MAILQEPVDTWIQHLPFTGQRPTPWGPADGIFSGVVGATGDATGGGVALVGNLSFERKEDWVYLLRHWSGQTDFLSSTMDFRFSLNSGPLVPNASAGRQFAQYTGVDNLNNFAGISVSAPFRTTQAPFQPQDIFLFGDKKIPGAFAFFQANFQTNTNAVDYSVSVSGLIFRYATFFRNVPASLA